MLSVCSNPACATPFLYLKNGRLFRLEPDPRLRTAKSAQVEHFWLCRDCASEMTLRLREDGKVVTALLPEAIRSVPEGVELTSVDRKTGLLLRSVNSTLPEHLSGRVRTRWKDVHHAA